MIQTISIRTCSTTPSLDKLHKLGGCQALSYYPKDGFRLPVLKCHGRPSGRAFPWLSELSICRRLVLCVWLEPSIARTVTVPSVPKPTSPHHWPLLSPILLAALARPCRTPAWTFLPCRCFGGRISFTTGLPMFTKAGIPQTSISNHPSKCTQYQESHTQITSSTPSDVNLASWRLPLLGSPFVLTSLLTLLPRVWPRDVHRRGDLHQLPAQVHIHPSQLSQITLQPDIG